MKNWYGNFTDGIENKETGELIMIEYRRELYQIWLYGKREGRQRGAHMRSATTWKDAITEAKDIAREYDTEQYW